MCIYGIFRDYIRFYYFHGREITRSKEHTSNSIHATTYESSIDSNIQWDGTFFMCFIKNFVAIMAPITKLTKKTNIFL